MKNMDSINVQRQALRALFAVVSSEYFLDEEIDLFAGRSEGQTAAGVSYTNAMNQVTSWCIYVLQTGSWAVSDDEVFADEVTRELLRWARASIVGMNLRVMEALYLSALIFIVDEFCAIWGTLGRTCTDTPLPDFRRALSDYLWQDYGLDLVVPGPSWTATLTGSRDLLSQWRVWAAL